MANELDYVLKMNATAFTAPLRGALSSVRSVDGATRQMGASVDGMRTSMTQAGAGAQSLFDKLAQLGGNLANVVSGVKAANEAFGWLKQRGQNAATANSAVAVTATAAATAARGSGAAAIAAGTGFGVMAGGAMGAVAALGAVAAVAVPVAAAMASLTVGMATAAVAYKGALKGVRLAADMEQDVIAFKTLTGSMNTAKDVLSQLTSMASSTPFQLPDLTGASRSLLAANVPVEALRSELTALGNVSAATGAKIGSLAIVYGQVAGKGKLYAEELQQFVEQGAGALKGAVADALGVSSSKLMEMMQDGQVGFSALQQAIQNLAGAGGRWASAMQEQSQTTWGLLSTVKDNVDGIFRAFGQPLNDGPVKTALQSLARVSEQTKQMIITTIGDGEIAEALHEVFVVGMDMAKNATVNAMKEIGSAIASGIDAVANPTRTAIQFAMGAELDTDSVDLTAAEAKRRLQERLEKAKIQIELTSDLDEKTKRLRAQQAKSGPAQFAKDLDAVDAPSSKGRGKGGEPAKVGQTIDIMKQELAVLEAQAKGQKALADVLKSDLDIRKEAAEIVRSTNASEAEALAIAQRRWAAQKGITSAAEAEAKAKRQDEKSKEDSKTATKQTEALDSLKAEFAILQAQATGQAELADELKREVSIRQEAKRIAESTGLDPKKAMQIARDKQALQDRAKGKTDAQGKEPDSRYGADGRRLSDGRKKIMGFSREKAGLPAFGGSGLLGGFRGAVAGAGKIQAPGRAPGIVPPGVAKEKQTRKQQEAAAAKMAEPRWDLVEQISNQLSGLGLV